MTKSRKQSAKKKITLGYILLSVFLILLGLFIIISPYINIKIDYNIIEKDIKVQSIKYEYHFKGDTDYLLTTDSKEKFKIDPGCCLKEFDEEVKEGDIAHIKYFKTYIFGIKRIQELSANGKTYVSQDYFKSGSKAIPIILGSIIFLFGCGGISLGCFGIKNERRKAMNRQKRIEKKYGSNARLNERKNDDNKKGVCLMNETLRVIAERYSCRNYDGRMPERDKLEAIAMAAVQSPSGMNRQPWRIVVVNDKALVDELDAEGLNVLKNGGDSDYYNLILKRGGKLFYNAPCMFLILKQPGREIDVGIVSENIALAAASLGLGSVIAASPSIPLKGPNGEQFGKKLKLPGGFEFGLSVLVGYAAAEGAPHQPDLSKVQFLK